MVRFSAFQSLVITFLCVTLMAPLVMADETTESFSIYTDKEEYLIGETVNIYVKAEAIDPGQNITVTDVVVYDPNNVSVAEWHNLTIVMTDTVTPAYVGSLIAQTEGSYTVSAKATGCPWILLAIWWFLCRYFRSKVIPEVPYGTVIAALLLVCATGLYMVRKKDQHKYEK